MKKLGKATASTFLCASLLAASCGSENQTASPKEVAAEKNRNEIAAFGPAGIWVQKKGCHGVPDGTKFSIGPNIVEHNSIGRIYDSREVSAKSGVVEDGTLNKTSGTLGVIDYTYRTRIFGSRGTESPELLYFLSMDRNKSNPYFDVTVVAGHGSGNRCFTTWRKE